MNRAQTSRDENLHAKILRKFDELSDIRRLRLLSAGYQVPPQMWSMLVVGALIIVASAIFSPAANLLRTLCLWKKAMLKVEVNGGDPPPDRHPSLRAAVGGRRRRQLQPREALFLGVD
jgi:hypothetical protein